MPTPASSDLERLLPGRVLTSSAARAAVARDLWSLATARVRRGETPPPPDAVVRPASVEDVSTLLAWCSQRGVAVVPAGARSGVCGGVAVDAQAIGDREAIVLDLTALTGVEVDEDDLVTTAMAGTPGPDYERALTERGLTGGHYPQSLHISTVGGWLACRSAGQFSTRYGKAEDLLAGLDVVLASGERLSLRAGPSSAAGPDLARLFCGSEGTLGVLVRARLRVARRRERVPHAFRFQRFAEGLQAVRGFVQDGVRPAVVRLHDEADTSFSFPELDGCVLVTVFEGPLAGAEAEVVAASGGSPLGPGPAQHWLEHRFDAVQTFEDVMRADGPLGPNVIVDTMEVAGPWSRIEDLYEDVRTALEPHAIGVLCHASHVYTDACCLYFTFAVQGTDEPDAERKYVASWEDGMAACLGAGGTITHHHGVGRLKARWLRRELGEGGWNLLRTLKGALDPAGILNPGNLGL